MKSFLRNSISYMAMLSGLVGYNDRARESYEK
jgi:hypothetical protein